MNFLIKIENGKPVNDPILEENLRFFYPDLDVNNPPEGYAKFVRKPYPELKPFQTIESTEYVIDIKLTVESKTTVWTDKYNIGTLSELEIISIANAEIQDANERMRKQFNAPYPAPKDGNLYVWASKSNKWVIMPDNFNEVVSKFTKKINELGLEKFTPNELHNIDMDKKQQLQQIINEINIHEELGLDLIK